VKKVSKTLCAYVALVVIYLVVTWITPSNHNPAVAHYHLSTTALHFISLTVVLPLIAIWFAALYGYAKLRKYAEMIKKNSDGKKVARLARALGFLAYSLPANSIISGILNYIGQTHTQLLPAMTIISHYASLVLPLIAFWLINQAAWALMNSIRRLPRAWVFQLFILAIVAIGVVYCYLVFKGAVLPGIMQRRVYYMPNWLVMSTLVVPYVFMWALGSLAALEIYIYEKQLAGIVYRHDWNFIASGIATIIVGDIAAQYLGTLSAQLSHARISTLLLIIYLLLIVLAVGYVLVAIGAKKLQRIEEV
jgi:hypothetical protein